MRVAGRSLTILVLLIIITVPAAVLRVLCVGRSCEREARGRQSVPFCSLPRDIRSLIVAGYQEGRSPDVLAVGEPTPLSARVAFAANGLRGPGSEIEIGLDDIAPTMANILRFDIPHPEVRSGKAATEVTTERPPRLVLLAVFKNLDQQQEMNVPGAAGREPLLGTAAMISLPLDPTALLATIGTGGTPAQHGVTGSHLRNDQGRLVRAWSGDAFPGTVIATLADDLDEALVQTPKIGLVGTSRIDQGLVGGDWYVDVDRDLRRFVDDSESAVDQARSLMRSERFGRDDVTDLLVVSVDASNLDVNDALATLDEMARRVSGGDAALVTVGLPAGEPGEELIDMQEVVRHVENETARGVVEEAALGGLFLDQEVLVDNGVTKDQVVSALRSATQDGRRVFADVFPGIAVSFARFC
ncbi:MAG TPA: hypothetical protein VE174_08705 [Actinomycetota bacterium]|nr:hypothetical protein [Actinomycetota bacterium]